MQYSKICHNYTTLLFQGVVESGEVKRKLVVLASGVHLQSLLVCNKEKSYVILRKPASTHAGLIKIIGPIGENSPERASGAFSQHSPSTSRFPQTDANLFQLRSDRLPQRPLRLFQAGSRFFPQDAATANL